MLQQSPCRHVLKPEGELVASTNRKNQHLVAVAPTPHPITDGVAPLHIVEETYKHMWISPKVQVLLETDNANSDRAVAWISPYLKSRVVYPEMGHDSRSHLHPSYRRLVCRAIQWAAGKLVAGATQVVSK